MANLRITPANDIDAATLEAVPSLLTAKPVTNVQLTARGSVARSSSIADQVIRGHWNTNSRKPDSFFIFRHTGYGGKVRLQLWGNDNYTSQVYDSGTLQITDALPTLETFEWGEAPLGLRMSDLLATEAAFYLYFTGVICASFTITFTECQNAYWEFGRIFLGKYYEAPFSPEQGMTFGPASNTEHQRSRGGSLRTLPGERWDVLKVNTAYATDATRAAWQDLYNRITNSDVAVSVFPGIGGRQERDHVKNMKLAEQTPFAWTNPTFQERTIELLEV